MAEFEAGTTPHERRVLRSRLEAARQLYNAVLGDLLRRLDAARRDPAWAAARALPTGRARTEAFRALRNCYSLSEYSTHAHRSLAAGCWIRQHLDVNTAQKVATRAWRAVEQHMYGSRGRPRFKRPGELVSVEGKTNRSGIRFCTTAELPRVEWNGQHGRLSVPLLIDAHDPLHKAALASPVRYVRLTRRHIRGRERFFCQLVCAGHPLVKHPAREQGRFGIDVGPSWVATSTPAGEADRHKLAAGADQKAKTRRRYQRKIDRQRRANNPDCFDQQGRAIRGKRPRNRSARQQRAERRLAEADRQLRATRRNEHGQLINRLLAEHGPVVHAERISYRAFQRVYGRSVSDRAPGRFMAELERKAKQQAGNLIEVPTRSTYLSQRCLCGRKRRKALSERQHCCGCEHVPVGTFVDRDELAAFLAIFCNQNGQFDQAAALAAWEGGANDRLLRTSTVREPVDKPRAPALGQAARTAGRSGSAGKRQWTPVTPRRRKRVRGKPRGQRRTVRTKTGAKPPGFSRGDH